MFKILKYLSVIALAVLFMGALAPPAVAFSLDFISDAGTAEKIAVYTAFAISIAAFLSTQFPSLAENRFFNVVLRVITYIGLNFGKAKNADEEPPSFPPA